jgi:hypothetical protein
VPVVTAAVLGCVAASLLFGGYLVAATDAPPSPAVPNERAITTHAAALPSLSPPLRLAFYYPWFPETWHRPDSSPGRYSRYRPSLGFYRSGDLRIVRRHIAAMRHARIHGGIVSWSGPGSRTDRRMPRLLRAATGTPVRFAVYHEMESKGDPTPAQISADLAHISRRHARHPNYLRISGRFVVFVYAESGDGCGMAERWRAGRVPGAYVVLKVFSGYRGCAAQPDGWHQYSPAVAESSHLPYSYSISPGFFKADEPAPRLARGVARFRQSALRMARSRARFQLITTFNEWGEGTAVESAREWSSRSGFGRYLDALRAIPNRLPAPGGPQPGPTPTTGGAAAPGAPGSGRPAPPAPSTAGPAVVAAVGDIACDPSSPSFNGGVGTTSSCHQKAVSDLVVNGGVDAFLPLGDLQYESGTFDAFTASYHPSFGRVKAVTYPAVGNHEYLTADAAGYFQYFGAAARGGYYSFDLGAWHLIALNSNCGQAGGCGDGSPQLNWLKADLAAHKTACTLAYWHHPRFSSGTHGNDADVEPVWSALWSAGADVVLNGHDHVYERFAPQTPTGAADPARGIRQFTVGTGGKGLTSIGSPIANSEVRHDQTFGVLMLTLLPDRYEWRFVPEAGKTFTDSGSAACH